MSYSLTVDSTLLNSIKMMSKASKKSQNIEKKVFTLLIARTGVRINPLRTSNFPFWPGFTRMRMQLNSMKIQRPSVPEIDAS